MIPYQDEIDSSEERGQQPVPVMSTGSRRTVVHVQAPPHVSRPRYSCPIPTLLQTYSAIDQLRRPAESFYEATTIPSPGGMAGPGSFHSHHGGSGLPTKSVNLSEGNGRLPSFFTQLNVSGQNRSNPAHIQQAEDISYRPNGNKRRSRRTEDLTQFSLRPPSPPHPHQTHSTQPETYLLGHSACSQSQSDREPGPRSIESINRNKERRTEQIQPEINIDDSSQNLHSQMASLKSSLEKALRESEEAKGATKGFKQDLAKLQRSVECLVAKIGQGDSPDRDSNSQTRTRRQMSGTKLSLVGASSSSSSSSLGFDYGSSSSSSHVLDYERLINMVRELNSLLGNSPSMELVYNSGGATFKATQAVTITLYKNGLTLSDSSNFRSYSSPSAAQLLQDIYDGFFPTELQSKYPDGIMLIVTDKRAEVHCGQGAFVGKGQKLSRGSPNLPKFYPGMKFKSRNKRHTQDDIKTSKSVQGLLPSVKSALIAQLPDLIIISPSQSDPRSSYKSDLNLNKSITLRLKDLSTGSAYRLRVSVGASIDEILAHLEAYLETILTGPDSIYEPLTERMSKNKFKFDLINPVPFGTFSNRAASLHDYGITSNSHVYFRQNF